MRLLRVLFATTDTQGTFNASETIAGRRYLRFLDLDLNEAGNHRCNRIVPQLALSSEAWTEAKAARQNSLTISQINVL